MKTAKALRRTIPPSILGVDLQLTRYDEKG